MTKQLLIMGIGDQREIRLRAVEPTDIDLLYRIENLPEVWRNSWGDAQVSRQMIWSYINSYSADLYADRQLRLIIEVDGEAVGTVDITDYDPRNSRAMIGIAVDPRFHRQGIATRAISDVITQCRDVFAMHQLAAMVSRDNPASLRLFEKLGFKTCGCLKSWQRRGRSYVDVILLQLML